MNSQGTLIPLEIALSYAVDWDFDRIVRDLVQNFYDSIGADRFSADFHMETRIAQDGGLVLEMNCHGYPFSYEWLTCVGASTKTGQPGKYVGMYGEGFKICLLCLYRKGISARMESKNWLLLPCQYTTQIGTSDVSMFGYDLRSRTDDGCTRLTLTGLTEYQIQRAMESPLNFFFPHNPLFGQRIAVSERYEIYERSEMTVPCLDFIKRIRGILYLNNLARGILPFDLVILVREDLRKHDFDSRKRKTLRDYEVIRLLSEFAPQFDAEASLRILMHMRRFWNDMPVKRVDIRTWYYFICQLVRNISRNPDVKVRFTDANHDLAYIDRIDADEALRKTIHETAAWARESEFARGKLLVNPIFRLLGAQSLVSEYESVRISQYAILPKDLEPLADLLYAAIETVFPVFLYDSRPAIRLSSTDEKTSPLQFSRRRYDRRQKGVRYAISSVVLIRSDFAEGKFRQTFLKLTEILLHAYGTRKSSRMNALFTRLGASIVSCERELDTYEKLWEDYVSSNLC